MASAHGRARHLDTAMTALARRCGSIVRGDVVAAPTIAVGMLVASLSLVLGASQRSLQVTSALTSVAAFLFGVQIAFTIVRAKERLAVVFNLIAKGNSGLFSVHELVAVFGERDSDRIRDLIDAHLTNQIDYRLTDYHMADASYLELIRAVCTLKPTTRQQEATYKELVALVVAMNADRGLIKAAVGQAMPAMEWVGLGTLLLVLLGLITTLPARSIPGALVAGVVAACLVNLMALLRRLDRLSWHERVTIWEPTAQLFRNIGLHPYVPRDVIESGRFRPVGTARVVDYVAPYPDRSERIVTLERRDGSGAAVRVTDLSDEMLVAESSVGTLAGRRVTRGSRRNERSAVGRDATRHDGGETRRSS